MRLNNNLVILDDIADPECVGVYNPYSNSFSVVHKKIYDYLLSQAQCDGFKNIYDDLLPEQVDTFINNGIFIADEQHYETKKHVPDLGCRQHQIRSVYLHLTMQCNLSCEYCYLSDTLNGEHLTLPIEKWKDALDRLHSAGMQGINITGGEALLYDDILELVSHAKSLGLQISLLTNGTLIDINPKVFELIDKCIVSLDTISSTKRNGIENYNVLQNIYDVANKYPDKISVRSVIVRGLEQESEELAEVLKHRNIQHKKVLCTPWHIDDICNIPDYDSMELYDDELAYPVRCGAGDTILALDPKGDIFPCQLMVKPEFKMGNIFDDDWLEQYKSNDINDKIACASALEHEQCTNCEAKHLCYGSCRALAYGVYGNLESINEFLCDFYKKSAKLSLQRTLNEVLSKGEDSI